MALEYNDENVASMFRTYEKFNHHKKMIELCSINEIPLYAQELLEDIKRIEDDFPHYLRLKLSLEKTTLDLLKKVTQTKINLSS